jgi:hypothetical protein
LGPQLGLVVVDPGGEQLEAVLGEVVDVRRGEVEVVREQRQVALYAVAEPS